MTEMSQPHRPHRAPTRRRPPSKKRASTHVSEAAPTAPRRRRSPSQGRSRETVAAILRAAALLLVEQGFAKTSTNTIAARAGVSIGSLYQYFGSKDAIFLELMAQHHRDVSALVGARLAQLDDPRTDLVTVLGKMMHDLVELHEHDPDVLQAMDRELAPLLARRTSEKHAELGPVVERVEGQLVARGARRTKATRSAAWLLTTTVGRVSHWIAHEAPASVDRQATIRGTLAMVRGLLEGIGIR
jgi:AcrR family transcriptional regulator